MYLNLNRFDFCPMHLDEAIAAVCGEICLQVHLIVTAATAPVKLEPGHVRDDDHATWIVDGTHFFTLVKAGGRTLAFCHTTRTLFYAKPEFSLGPAAPDGHAFLGQIVRDNDSTVRLLMMDLVLPRVEDPRARGDCLRRCADLFPSACVIQWAGAPDALRRFVAGGLPHAVSGIAALGPPLTLTQEVQ